MGDSERGISCQAWTTGTGLERTCPSRRYSRRRSRIARPAFLPTSVVVPSRSLGGGSYLYREPNGPLLALGLLSLADVPLGGVVRSLAACLSSKAVDEFLRRFHEGFKEEISKPSWETPAHFAFAEYLRSEEHTSELQSRQYLVCRLLLE